MASTQAPSTITADRQMSDSQAVGRHATKNQARIFSELLYRGSASIMLHGDFVGTLRDKRNPAPAKRLRHSSSMRS